MDGFDKQLRARQENDEALLEHAFASISDAVFGSRTADRFKTDAEKVKTAIDEILFYYRVSTREVPEEIQDLDEQLEYLCVRTALCAKTSPWKKDGIGTQSARCWARENPTGAWWRFCLRECSDMCTGMN